MILARTVGSVTATHKHRSYTGHRLAVCQPLSADGIPEGSPIVAIDPEKAGLHQRVIVSTDGMAARAVVGDRKSPVRHMIVGILDDDGRPA
jgi:ethanolamine utilization protein EutN